MTCDEENIYLKNTETGAEKTFKVFNFLKEKSYHWGELDIDCKENKNNASVVMVGYDNQLSPELKQKIKNEWSWTGGNGSIVEGGRRYSKIFEGIQTKSGKPRNSGRFNRPTLNLYISTSHEKKALLENLCPWIEKINERSGRECRDRNFRGIDVSNLKLPQFLNSDYAKSYFEGKVWEQYQGGGKYLALLALMNLWSTDLVSIYFPNSVKIFDHEQDNFKLNSLMTSAGKILYLKSEAQGNELDSISYHSGGMWTVQLCPNSSSCSGDNGLKLTLGDGKFCVVGDVCFSKGDEKSVFQNGRAGWKSLRSGGDTALWSHVFKDQQAESNVNNLFVALVVACFGDVRNVSLTVQKPSEEGDLIFTHLK